jgi:1-acyl-sn-glycerol-3-phosphate acyltransferase
MSDRLPFMPRLTGAWLRICLWFITRVNVEGLENVPRTGPLLVIANHASNVDGMLLMAYVIPKMGRPMRWLGKEEALRWPLFGSIMKANGVFAVRRGAGDLEAFKVAKKVLDDGNVLAIFPEGSRSNDGAMRDAKKGATVLAVRSGAPILPIALVDTQRFWPRGGWPRPGRRMVVRIGPTFTLTMTRGGDRAEAVRSATADLMGHIAALLPEEQRGVFAAAVTAPADATDTAGKRPIP